MLRTAVLIAALSTFACVNSRERPASALLDAANAALRRGDIAAAERLAGEGVSRTASNPHDELTWSFRLLRAEILLGKRDLSEALQISTAQLPDGAQFQPLRARQKYLRARVAHAQGRLPEALTLATEAAHEGQDAGLKAEVGAFGGQVAMQLGQWSRGEEQLEAAIGMARQSRERYAEALGLNVMGMGKIVRSRYDEALVWFERILSLSDLAETALYARALNNAGLCYTRLGQFDRAADAQRRAIKAAEGRPTSTDYEQFLGQLGNTHILQGNTREGLAYLQRAFNAARDAKLDADATLWAGNLATAYIDLGEWDVAERYNDEAKRLSAITRSGRPVYNTLNSAAIAAGRNRHDEATRLYEEALASPDPPPSVVWDAHFGLANVASAAKQPERATREFEAALAVIERTRSGLLKTDYKLSYLTRLISFYQSYVDTLLARGQIERALEVADSSRGRVLAERQGGAPPPRASAATLRGLAKDSRSVMLSYWLTPAKSYVWVVNGSGISVVSLPPAKEIEALVRQHQGAIANALVDPLATNATAGDRLFQILVAPALASIPTGASVIVVADGALHGVNFETLPVDGARRHYWIEDVELQIAPSLASLTMPTAASKSARSVLLIGDPTPRPPEFPALTYAPAEMTSVAKQFGADRVTSFDRDRASPSAYRDAQPDRFAYIHFAAHATANVESPLDSAVILSGPDAAHKLYARDVAAIPLTAELVTVSACRGAGERAYSGEGLVGFSWAFLRAGARHVVAGLWDVNDRSTAQLMEQLYAGLAAGERPARALRKAKLALLQRRESAAPYHWGPFELFTIELSLTS